MEYGIVERLKKLGIKYTIDSDETLTKIEIQIKENQAIIDNDECDVPKINTVKQIDIVNYQLCVKNIIDCISERKIYYNNLFTFNIQKKCPISNYSYMAIFFGPIDSKNFFKGKYVNVLNKIQDDVILNICVDENNKIQFNIKSCNQVFNL